MFTTIAQEKLTIHRFICRIHTMDELSAIRKDIKKAADSKKAQLFQRFFKTGEGEYGYGDIFVGLTVPQSRLLSKKYAHLSLTDVTLLLTSSVHEERLIALFLLIQQFNKSSEPIKKEIYQRYLSHTKYINNWDLVDSSAYHIVGAYLWMIQNQKSRFWTSQNDTLTKLAKSPNLWERRIAIIATYCFIRENNFEETLRIAEILLTDKHDLMHKAVGWMLREMGKKNQEVEEIFLRKHYKKMPRTMLRYAIERFDEEKRKKYLAGTV